MRWLVLAALVATPAWAGKKKLPCWVTAPCDPWPAEAWLVGVGSGATPGAADDAARATVAKTFSVRVQQTQEQVKEAWASSAGSDQRSRLVVQTRADTDRELDGVAIVARHRDLKSGNFYALAALERGPAVANIQAEIAAVDKELAALNAGAGLERVRHLYRSLPLVEQLALLHDELSVIEGTSHTPSISYAERAGEWQRAVDGLQVQVTARDPHAAALTEAVTAAGLKVGEGALKVVLEVEERTGKADNFGFVQATAEGTVRVQDGETTLRDLVFKGEAASQSASKARALAREDLSKKLAGVSDELVKVLQ